MTPTIYREDPLCNKRQILLFIKIPDSTFPLNPEPCSHTILEFDYILRNNLTVVTIKLWNRKTTM